MEKKKYYAITTSIIYEKMVLVPVDSVEDIDEAIDLVDCGVETCSIKMLHDMPDYITKASPYADENGIYELTDSEAARYQILEGDYDDEE